MSIAVERADTRVPVPEGDRFAALSRSPRFSQVVAANRLYLAAAVADALRDEREKWALSCLPATGHNDRYSTVSMGGQETFAVFKPRHDRALTAHVVVSASSLLSSGAASPGAGLDALGLDVVASHYTAGGPDQIIVFGPWQSLARALADQPLRLAAREFARHLMAARTCYARYHDEELASRVLGRS